MNATRHELPAMSTGEKIATVARAKTSGRLGTFVPLELADAPHLFGRVELDGLTALVGRRGNLWSVQVGPFEGLDRDLEEAARLAVDWWTSRLRRAGGRGVASRVEA